VEMVLKIEVGADKNYTEQEKWGNKTDGSFESYNKLEIDGITFYRKYTQSRNNEFPIKQLFEKIDKELSENRMVIVSLQVPCGWHMYIIYEKNNNEYWGFSKNDQETIYEHNIKNIIKNMNGTDILVYEKRL
jgi:hypothetical protein